MARSARTRVRRAGLAALIGLVAGACDGGLSGEGVWETDVHGIVSTTNGDPIAGAEVKGHVHPDSVSDWWDEVWDDVDTTDAQGRYHVAIGVWGGGSGCNDGHYGHVQVVRQLGDAADTTRVSMPVELCIDRDSETVVNFVLPATASLQNERGR